MTKTVDIILPVDPAHIAHQSVRTSASISGGVAVLRHYQPKEKVKTKQMLQALFTAAAKANGINWQETKNSYVIVNSLTYRFTIPESIPSKLKKLLSQGYEIRKNTKPDITDNLNKLLFDAMSKTMIYDDARVCEVHNLKKVYSLTPCIEISLTIDDSPMSTISQFCVKKLDRMAGLNNL